MAGKPTRAPRRPPPGAAAGGGGGGGSASMLTWLGLALLILISDQFTKVLVTGYFKLGDSTTVTSFFNLVRVHNEGAAFSFLAGASGWQRWLFTGIGLVAVVVIVWMLRAHAGQRLFAFALACILGGAIGNLVDRIAYGHLVDFLQFHYAGWYFPSFNIADSAITIGAVTLILDELLRVRRSR